MSENMEENKENLRPSGAQPSGEVPEDKERGKPIEPSGEEEKVEAKEEAKGEEKKEEATEEKAEAKPESEVEEKEEVKAETEEKVEVKKEEKEDVEVKEEKKKEKPKKEKKKEAKAEVKEEAKEEVKAEVEEEEEKPKKGKARGKKKEKKEEKTERRWYVVQTYSGQEDRVRDSIERNVQSMNMQHKIFRILVPTEETVELKDGKRVDKVRKMFAGYIFVEMVLDDESWYVIRGTPGVAKFIGTKVMPTPVSDKEMQRVLKQIGVKEEKLEVSFERGEAVRIISGPFRGYTGSIDEVNAQKGKLKILISIFGRDTPVEVNFEQVQRIV
jgi:transcriptional antiterminator NusG